MPKVVIIDRIVNERCRGLQSRHAAGLGHAGAQPVPRVRRWRHTPPSAQACAAILVGIYFQYEPHTQEACLTGHSGPLFALSQA